MWEHAGNVHSQQRKLVKPQPGGWLWLRHHELLSVASPQRGTGLLVLVVLMAQHHTGSSGGAVSSHNSLGRMNVSLLPL